MAEKIFIEELDATISIMLNQFRVTFRKISILRGTSMQFMIKDFGLIVCAIDRADYSQVSNIVTSGFEDWNTVFITTSDSILDKKDEVLWALMRGGYMRWLRLTYPRQLKSVLFGENNLAQKIIEERLRIWGDKTKYTFFIEDNKEALRGGLYIDFSNDPSFFDYMP